MTRKGMEAMEADDQTLSDGKYSCASPPTRPITNPNNTALPTKRRRAAATAPREATRSVAKLAGELRPTRGVRRIPLSPASTVVATHTPIKIHPGLAPE